MADENTGAENGTENNNAPAGNEGSSGMDKLKADVEKWKSLSRQNEDKWKSASAAQKELEELKKANLSEQERLVEDAKTSARAEALKDFGSRLVGAEIRAKVGSRLTDEKLSGLMEGMALEKFLTEAGEVNTDKVASFVLAILPEAPDGGAPAGTGLNGVQGAKEDPNGGREDIDSLIAAARKRGDVREALRLNNLKLMEAMNK